MKILINNKAGLPNKYVRFIKWKLYQLKRKFGHLLYVEIFLNKEGSSPVRYENVIRLGVPGHDIIIKNKSEQLGPLLNQSKKEAHRYLNKYKNLAEHS